MQNAACSCEPRTAAPAASASIKPAKIDCCFSEMCWGKLAERTHSFSARGKQKAPGHCCIYVKTSNYSLSLRTFGLEAPWEYLAWSREAFLHLEKNCCVLHLSKYLWPGSTSVVSWHQGFSGGGAVCHLYSDLAWIQSLGSLQGLA